MYSRIFRIRIINVIIFLFVCLGCSSNENNQTLNRDISVSELQQHVYWLADPALEGRIAGSKYEAMSANYIADYFHEIGLEPGGDDDTFFQLFSLKGPMTEAMDLDGYLSRNVIGIVPGNSEIDKYLVIGAHYDAQGKGGIISMDNSMEPKVHPGADDNASGMAAILELAQYFSNYQPERTWVFIAFSGEELGLLGSRHFVANSTLPEGEILAMINLDMIGRMESRELSIMGTGTALAWPGLIDEFNADSLKISQVTTGRGASDHTAFYEQDIPVLHYFTGTHNDYHRPGDTADKVNFDGLKKVINHVQRVIREVDTIELSELAFVQSGDRQPERMQRSSVTLGVLPDYSYDGVGLRLESVREGDPGEIAGLIAGDIIIEIEGRLVNDIFDYMDLIGDYDFGDSVELLALRDGEELTIRVTF